MRQSLTLEILEHLAVCAVPMMVSSFYVPHGMTLGQAVRDAERRAERCIHDFSLHSRRTVSTTLCRLKNQGIVNNKGPHHKTIWYITKRGKRHFVSEKATGKTALPPEDGRVRLVVFDIPEERRGQRDWLRIRLRSCEYTPFQKSVWVGTRPLPEKLLNEFRERGIAEHIHAVGLEDVLENVKTLRD